jgi:uncharacterized protein (DUF302 family)
MSISPPSGSPADIVSKLAPGTVAEVLSKFVALIDERGMTLFSVVDHSGQATQHGLELRDTKLAIFGSPVGGTPVMQARPLAALDLPLKVLIWDDEGQTTVSYTDPVTLAARHALSDELASRLAVIGPLTDALVSRS